MKAWAFTNQTGRGGRESHACEEVESCFSYVVDGQSLCRVVWQYVVTI